MPLKALFKSVGVDTLDDVRPTGPIVLDWHVSVLGLAASSSSSSVSRWRCRSFCLSTDNLIWRAHSGRSLYFVGIAAPTGIFAEITVLLETQLTYTRKQYHRSTVNCLSFPRVPANGYFLKKGLFSATTDQGDEGTWLRRYAKKALVFSWSLAEVVFYFTVGLVWKATYFSPF